ncbi:GNAT family N-acetyltransferase [Actinoplanes sp. NPDC049316]|uniref:GNAT family N-acetyltransferase n=1 Tax=Actinoplanes sp. NPDC049316 TaxID=3154727 RepID=UPI003441C1FC
MATPAAPGRLAVPDVRYRGSFLAAMAEFAAEGRGGATDSTEVGQEIRTFGGSWGSPEGFAAYVRWLLDQARENAPRPEGYVPATNLWMLDGDGYVGRIAIRHRLTEALRRVGGHIGYDVRPSARRRGYATHMLRDALPVARGLGITTALVMCDVGNVASRRVIERNGGVLQDEAGGKLRFWVPTA